jgi:hypothetical protein
MFPQPHAPPPQHPPPEAGPSPEEGDAEERPPVMTITGVKTRRAAAVPQFGQAGRPRLSYSATVATISNS